MDRDVDLPLLRTLLAVVDAGSLTEASRRMFRTQPAISQRIQRLEEIVGVAVLRRNLAGVALTSEGEIVHGYAKAIIALHDNLVRAVREEVTVQVRIGIAEECGVASWGWAFAQLRKQFPRTRLAFDFQLDAVVERLFRAGECDIAVRATGSPPQHPDVTTFRSPLVWVSAAGAPIDEQAAVNLVLMPPGSSFRAQILSSLTGEGFRWSVVCEATSARSVYEAVKAGWGISAVPLCTLPNGLDYVECKGFPVLPTVYISIARDPLSVCLATARIASSLEQFLRGDRLHQEAGIRQVADD